MGLRPVNCIVEQTFEGMKIFLSMGVPTRGSTAHESNDGSSCVFVVWKVPIPVAQLLVAQVLRAQSTSRRLNHGPWTAPANFNEGRFLYFQFI